MGEPSLRPRSFKHGFSPTCAHSLPQSAFHRLFKNMITRIRVSCIHFHWSYSGSSEILSIRRACIVYSGLICGVCSDAVARLLFCQQTTRWSWCVTLIFLRLCQHWQVESCKNFKPWNVLAPKQYHNNDFCSGSGPEQFIISFDIRGAISHP